jgi:hypothetical protein
MSNIGLEASCFFQGFGGNGEPSYSLNPLGLTNLERIVCQERISQVVLLELPAKLENLSEIVAVCNRLGSRLLLVDNFPEIFNRRISHFNLSGLDVITVMEEPLEDPVNRLMKRAMDIMISGFVASLVLPPLALLVAVFQRCQSPGPLSFSCKRGPAEIASPLGSLSFVRCLQETIVPRGKQRETTSACTTPVAG